MYVANIYKYKFYFHYYTLDPDFKVVVKKVWNLKVQSHGVRASSPLNFI